MPVIDSPFPGAEETVDAERIRSRSYRRRGTEIKVSSIPAGAVVPSHAHPEVQLGMVLTGHLEVTVGHVTRRMRPLGDCYIAPPEVLHAAVNDSGAVVTALDLKRLEPDERYTAPEAFFVNERSGPTGPTFLHDWLGLALLDLPPGAELRTEGDDHEEHMGVCLSGRITVTAADATVTLAPGEAFLCVPGERHLATNPFTGAAALAHITVVPRR